MSEQMPPGAREPTEEELRQYLGEMRQAHVGEIVAQVVSALLNGAQVKLGRRDARLLIDMAAGVNEQATPHLEQGFSEEVTQVLGQLRMAQVEAEEELAKLRASGQAPPEANDLGTGQAAGAAPDDTGSADDTGSPSASSAADSAASRLWTPGR